MKHGKIFLLAVLSFAALDAAAAGATATVTLSGGSNAGHHEASSDRGGCSTGLTGPNSFGTQISNPKEKDPKKLNSVQLDVPDKAKPSDFHLSLGFGPLLTRTATYTIDTRKKSGSGSIALADNGTSASVKFSGTTADGVKIEGAIDCKSVLRAGKK